MDDPYFNQWIYELRKYFGPAGHKVEPVIWYRFYKNGLTPEQTIEHIILKFLF